MLALVHRSENCNVGKDFDNHLLGQPPYFINEEGDSEKLTGSSKFVQLTICQARAGFPTKSKKRF